MRGLLSVVLSAALTVAMSACEPEGESEGRASQGSGLAAVEDGTVPLTVYLRAGGGEEATLQPVTRQVPVDDDLPRRATELLLEGPVGDEDLEAPWPEGITVDLVDVDHGVATVDLSQDVLAEAPQSEHLAHREALALGALANTLTEFPGVEEVQITVGGEGAEDDEDVAAFWGGWGLPPVLTRDESLIEEKGEHRLPARDAFSPGAQSIGSTDAEPVVVRSVRVRDRITHLRIVMEIAEAADPDASAPEFPRVFARAAGDELTLELTDVAEVEQDAVPEDLAERLEPLFSDVEVGDGRGTASLLLSLTPAAGRADEFYLHTRESPSRIVMDVKK